ncbi:shugoshin 1 isoform X2 [Eublepharis macularius]|nr:shugoshin 1 isoform X2 [Eublepharis macularius]
MARERCLKKSFKDSLEDIKERMKEKRNQRLARLGKSYVLGKSNAVLSAKGIIADDTSMQLKNFKANNRALALALEEEKSKMREAQDIILYLRREYQSLKFQTFVLQRKIELQQKEDAEARLLTVKNVISNAVQNLLEAANLLGPAKDLCTTEANQTLCVPALEECDSNYGRNQTAMTLLKPDFTIDANRQEKTFTSEIEDNTDKNSLNFASDCWQDVENIPTALTPKANKGWPNSSNEDYHQNESINISSNKKNKQPGNFLPKSVSTRRRYLKIQNQTEFCVSDGNNLEITDQIKESYEQEKTRPEEGLKMTNEEMHLCEENIYHTNTDQSLAHSYMLTKSNISAADLKETDFNRLGDSQTQKERGQKRKLEEVKNRSRIRSKKKSQSKHSCSKEKTNSSVCPGDAYDFIFEESIHVTPFRQNKENDDIMDNKSFTEEKCSDSFTSEDDSDDSLYVPYKNKSKSRKTLSFGSDAVPVHTRPRLKKTVLEQHERTTDGKNQNAENAKCTDKLTSESKYSGSNAVMKIAEEVPCSILTVVDKEKEHKISSSFENISFKTDRPSEGLQKLRHLGDITNLTPSSTKIRDSLPPVATEEKDSIHQKRRCTVSMCYKEPPINRKLRRGDPFTDTGFLNSPIFKEKKSCNYKSVKKKSLSRYNEAFVGAKCVT